MTALAPNLDNPFNQQFGHPNERVANKVKDTLPGPSRTSSAVAFYSHEPPATVEGWCDASPKVVCLASSRSSMRRTCSSLTSPGTSCSSLTSYVGHPRVGIVFFIPGCLTSPASRQVIILSAEEVKRREVEPQCIPRR